MLCALQLLIFYFRIRNIFQPLWSAQMITAHLSGGPREIQNTTVKTKKKSLKWFDKNWKGRVCRKEQLCWLQSTGDWADERKHLGKLKPAHKKSLLLLLSTSQTFYNLNDLPVYNTFSIFLLSGLFLAVINWNQIETSPPFSLHECCYLKN